MQTMEEVRRLGIEALTRELGPIGMVRFLQMFENGTGDYVEERHERHDREALELGKSQIADKGKITQNA